MSGARSLHALRISRRHFSRSQARLLSIAADSSALAAQETTSAHDDLVSQKLEHLQTALSQERHHPNRIWAYYQSAASVVGYSNLPLEIHKQVLRKCTPSAASVRAAAMRRFAQGLRPLAPHIHEGRFQAIVRHIRALGEKPDIGDYNFVLEQFAATGHHTGSIMVFKELRRLNVVPDAKTYGLVLQSLARKLALPCHYLARPRLVNQTRKMLGDLLADMQETHTSMVGVNVDLMLRILKETMDVEGFETLTKLVYGIDLQNPDRPVLVQAANAESSTSASSVSPMFADLAPSQHLPFTTSALNTTLDMLGRFGQVSRLVQAFEVLTTPLPPRAAANFFSSQYDEEDDDWGFTQRPDATTNTSTAPSSSPQPYAKANTTSYAILIRHLSHLNHAVFVRHYLKQAMSLDWSVRGALRRSVRTLPLDQVQPPSFAITKNMLLSAHGLANREKMLSLSKWLDSKIPKLIRMKNKDLEFFKQKMDELQLEDVDEAPPSTVVVSPKTATSSVHEDSVESSSSRSPLRHFPELELPLSETTAVATSATSQSKPFSLPLHVSILKRDITEMTNFYQYHTQVLGRNTQRLKEKLGRRVWRGQNVYLASAGSRKKMSKAQWGDIVNFRERKNVIVGDRDKRKVAPGQPGMFIKPRWLEDQLAQLGRLGTSSRMDRL